MRDGMLSIGEVARMKGVGIKALRYYDEVGVLTPAFVDPQTGYRYYSPHQLARLDTIMLCVDLGIPLREVRAHLSDDGAFDADPLFDQACEAATAMLRRARASLIAIAGHRSYSEVERRFRHAPAPYERTVGPSLLLATPLPHLREYAHATAWLYRSARERDLVPLPVQGVARLPGAGLGAAWHAVIEVQPIGEEAGEYTEVSGPVEAGEPAKTGKPVGGKAIEFAGTDGSFDGEAGEPFGGEAGKSSGAASLPKGAHAATRSPLQVSAPNDIACVRLAEGRWQGRRIEAPTLGACLEQAMASVDADAGGADASTTAGKTDPHANGPRDRVDAGGMNMGASKAIANAGAGEARKANARANSGACEAPGSTGAGDNACGARGTDEAGAIHAFDPALTSDVLISEIWNSEVRDGHVSVELLRRMG